jgi:SAM-dependent methyltransferase
MSTENPGKETETNLNHISPFDESAGEYDAWFDGKGKLIFDIEVKAFQGILTSLPKPWLEIGTGSGRFAQALGIDSGLEPSRNLAKIAQQRGIKTFEYKGEERIFEEGSFGTIFLVTTLCFLESPVDVLKEAHRILKPGGKIVLGVIPQTSPWGLQYTQKQAECHPIYKNAVFFKINEIARLSLQSGFMGERIISTLFQKPGEVQHIEEPREGLYSEAGFVIVVAEKR